MKDAFSLLVLQAESDDILEMEQNMNLEINNYLHNTETVVYKMMQMDNKWTNCMLVYYSDLDMLQE